VPWERGVVIGGRWIVVVVGLYNRMSMNVDVAAPANAHRINAGGFPKDVAVTPMVTFKMVPPLTGGTKIFAFVISKCFGRL
jgi:hypothetical protein